MSVDKTQENLSIVSSAQIVDGSIVSSKIASASVDSTKINSGSASSNLILQSDGSSGALWSSGEKSTLTTSGDILYSSAANVLARLGIGSDGSVLKVLSGIPSWGTLGTVSLNSFTTSGTWTKPAGATRAIILAIGGGGSGAPGGRATNHNGNGGTGGGGGAVVSGSFDISSVSSMSITVGAGGISINGSTSAGDTKDGQNGGLTIVGSFLTASGGSGGKYMQETDTGTFYAPANWGSISRWQSTTIANAPDGSPGWVSSTTGNRSAYNALFFAGGGGAGGSQQNQVGGRGGTGLGRGGTGPAGGAAGQDAASAGTSGTVIGDGGGGAGAHAGGGTPHSGGSGYLGGGGGGGGLAATTNTGGSSGAGGSGYVMVISF